MTSLTDTNQKKGRARFRWLELGELEVSIHAQRRFIQASGDKLALKFDLDKMGNPVISERDGRFFIIDGQTRVYAAKKFGFADTDKVQCAVYEGLTEKQEADLFLALNDSKAVGAFDKFRVGVNAGREEESNINRVVGAQRLHVARSRRPDGIASVASLRTAYNRTGAAGLGTTLRILRDGFGDAGFDGPLIDGINLCIHRYNGRVDEERMVDRLSRTNGGAAGLMGVARKTHLDVGASLAQCVAAAATTAYNRGRSGKARLPSWWKTEEK